MVLVLCGAKSARHHHYTRNNSIQNVGIYVCWQVIAQTPMGINQLGKALLTRGTLADKGRSLKPLDIARQDESKGLTIAWLKLDSFSRSASSARQSLSGLSNSTDKMDSKGLAHSLPCCLTTKPSSPIHDISSSVVPRYALCLPCLSPLLSREAEHLYLFLFPLG